MAANSYRSSIQQDSFLAEDPLHLSAHGALDDFDFSLSAEEGEGEDPRRLMASSTSSDSRPFAGSERSESSAAIDGLLRGSGMDFAFESLTGSLNRMSVSLTGSLNRMLRMSVDGNTGVDGDADAAVHGKEPAASTVTLTPPRGNRKEPEAATARGPSGSRRAARQGQGLSEGRPGPGTQAPKRLINAVNFDPPSEPPKTRREPPTQRRHQSLQPARPAGHTELPAPPSLPTLTEERYSEALEKLAESMKRTEESRRRVMAQRAMLTPSQRRALSSAREEQLGRGGQRPICQAPPRDENAAAFFSGSRGTLTNGLEHSRKQLERHMGPEQPNYAVHQYARTA